MEKNKFNIASFLILCLISIIVIEIILYQQKKITKLENQISTLESTIVSNEQKIENSKETINILTEKIKNLNNSENSLLIELSFLEFQTKLTNKDSFILIFTQPSCSHCINYKLTFNTILNENNLVAYELVLSNLSSTEKEALNNIVNIEGTPTTIFVKNGQEIKANRLIGNIEKTKLETKLSKLGYI